MAYSEHKGKRRIKQCQSQNTQQLLIDPSCQNIILVSTNGSLRVLALITSPALQSLQDEVVYDAHVRSSSLVDSVCWETCSGVSMVILGYEVSFKASDPRIIIRRLWKRTALVCDIPGFVHSRRRILLLYPVHSSKGRSISFPSNFQNREIIFVELTSGDILFRVQSPISIQSINVCPSDANHHKRTLLVQGNQGEKVHLFLESRSDPRIVFPPDSRSVFLPLNKFDADVSMSVQGDLLLVLKPDTLQVDVSL